MRLVILILLLSAAGCRDVPLLPSVTPYKMDIQQGNVVTQDMVEKLQPGMSRAQVRFILGTPLVVDAFRTDRWDYVYMYRKGGEVPEQRRLIVFFKDDKLLRVDGDQMPPGPAPRSAASVVKPAASPAAGAPAVAGDKPAAAKPEPVKDEAGADAGKKEPQGEEKGFFGRMLEKLGF
jgi:outer membrane protein assembly factor BamE